MFDCIEVHEGEPLRIVTSGVPSIPGTSVYDKYIWLKENDIQMCELLTMEPRGVPATCASLIVQSDNPGAKAGFIIMTRGGYAMMSGATAMATATALLEAGFLPIEEPITEFDLESPAGLIHFVCHCKNGKVTRASFCNAPCFPLLIDQEITVPTLGKVTVSVVWGGGSFSVCIDSRQFPKLSLIPDQSQEIMRLSALCTQAAVEQLSFCHPEYPEEKYMISMLYEPSDKEGVTVRSSNAYNMTKINLKKPETWIATLDRGVCGNGTGALMALEYVKGNLKPGEEYVNEGLFDLRFYGTIAEETKIGDYKAIVPCVGGQCWVYGYTKWILEDTDPFPNGFVLNN